MTISRMMNAGLSGIQSTGRSLAVTSDNIANINTVGHRSSRAIFQDVLTQNIVGVGDLGAGSRVSTIDSLFHQGTILGSARATDMAISGKGFFTLRGRVGGVDGQFFSRAGQFTTDNSGFLVNSDGLRLQGYPADARGNILPTLGDLQLNTGLLPPVATTTANLEIQFNGNPQDPIIPTPVAPAPAFDPTDPATYSDQTTMTVYDSIGNAHRVDVYFVKRSLTSWEYHAQVDGGETVGGTAGTPVEIETGTVNMVSGAFGNQTAVTTTPVNFLGATAAQSVNFDFTGSTGVSHDPAAGYAVRAAGQDGSAAAEFLEVAVNTDGSIDARYNDGRIRTVGRVALASFTSEVNLTRLGGTLFQQTPSSGEPAIGFAGAGGRGSLQGSALESSNVDLSTEFVKLITDQRAYQATSRTITTADELLVETVNLKR